MKHMKKLMAMLLAVVMTLGMAVSVFAETTGKITVNVPETATVKAYQVLENDQETGAWKLTTWASTALGENASTALSVLTNAENSNKNTVAVYLTTLAAYVGNSTNSVDAAATQITTGEGSAELATTALGSYLVLVTSDNYTYTNMLVSNYSKTNGDVNGLSDVTVTAKGVKKDILESKTADKETVSVGDVITYTVTGTMPHFEGTGEPSLVITDTLSANTKLQIAGDSIAASDITVKVNNTELEATKYTVEATEGGFKLTFDADYLKENAKEIAEKTFTLTYKVEVTGYEMDNQYTNKVTATVKVTGTEEPDSEKEHTSYTAALKLVKTNEDGTKKLEGASFVLTTTVNEATKYVKVAEDGKVSYVDTETDATTFTTDDKGAISITGLNPDYTYTIKETKAPKGYAKGADGQIKFVAATGTDGNKTGKYTVTLVGENSAYTVETTTATQPTVTIANSQMGELPATGGTGIMILTFAGVVMMMAFGGMFMALRKKEK